MVKVCVLGASGGIGQPLSLLLKANPYVSELSLYDINDITGGIAKDLSHINTNSNCNGYHKQEDYVKALENSEIVIITAGVPRKPGMTRDDLFKINAKIVKGLTVQYGNYSPITSKLLIISNPVNSLIPVVVETLKGMGRFNASEVMGITMLDLVRAQTFLVDFLNDNKIKSQSLSSIKAKQFNKKLNVNNITVIGGHSGSTIIPILTNKRLIKDQKEYKKIIHKIQFGGDEIVKAKNGKGSATLSMAFAGYFFTNEILSKINCDSKLGDTNLPCFVYLPDLHNGKQLQTRLKELTGRTDEINYFSIPVRINEKSGNIKEVDLSLFESIDVNSKLNEFETYLLKESCQTLVADIKKGEDFVLNNVKL